MGALDGRDWIGKRIRNIEIQELMGAGGMGWVYLGFDHALQRRVALKILRPTVGLSEKGKSRFLREARVLSRLQHVNICRIHDLLEHNGVEILVLEYVEGTNLAVALKDGLSERRRFIVARQLTEALVAAHGAGIVHRDLKPENVMWAPDVGPEGQVKVLDFGLARAQEPRGEAGRPDGETPASPSPRTFEELPTEVAGSPHATSGRSPEDAAPVGGPSAPDSGSGPWFLNAPPVPVTQLGSVVGTLGYMSPEQARGERLTTAGDMFSLGLIFHELFGGRPAYDPELAPMEKIRRVAAAEIEPLQGVEPGLATLIRRLESPNPAERPRAVDVLNRLDQLAGRRRRRVRQAVAAAVFCALVAFGLRGSWDIRQERQAVAELQEEVDLYRALIDDLLPGLSIPNDRSEGVEEAAPAPTPTLDVTAGPTRLRVLRLLSAAAAAEGDGEAALKLSARAVEVARTVGEPELLGLALLRHGLERRRAGDEDAARAVWENCLGLPVDEDLKAAAPVSDTPSTAVPTAEDDPAP